MRFSTAIPRGPLRRRGVLAAAGAAAVAGALAVPAATTAADLVALGTCFASGQDVAISGTAFSPGATVTISGGASATVRADPAGTVSATIAAPQISRLGPRRIRITAVDGLNPANRATVRLRVVRRAFGSNLPLAGRPHELTTWRFAGFAAGRPIYAHFILGGRSRGDHRFGVARGACGTLRARAQRVPGVRNLEPGHWTVKLDQRRTYGDDTPGSEARFRILRRDDDEGGPGPG